jgi:hypothetical protein
MCRHMRTLHTSERRIREVFNPEHTAPLGLKPRYNIAPSQQVPIVRDTQTGREMVMAKWGCNETIARAHAGHHRAGASGPVDGYESHGQGRDHGLSQLVPLHQSCDLPDQYVGELPKTR